MLGIFCHLITLVLGQHSVKGLRVNKDIKETKFEGVCNKSELKKKFLVRITHKILETNLIFFLKLETFLIFFNSVRFSVLGRSTTTLATRIYHVYN